MKERTLNYRNALNAEFRKHRYLKLSLVPLGFLCCLFIWSLWGNKDITPYDRAQGYTYLLYQLPVMNCILLPVMLSVISSRLCDMEIKGHTLKLLYTMQEKSCFYDLKFFHELVYILVFTIGETALIIISGIIFKFTEPIPVPMLLLHTVSTSLTSFVILTLQHYLSLSSENQIIPLLAGLIGSFLGLFSLFFPPAVARLVIWSYYCAFTPLKMEWDQSTRIISFYKIPFPIVTFILFTAFAIIFYLICRTLFIKKEMV